MNSIQSALSANKGSRLAEIALMIRYHITDNKLLIVVEGSSDKEIYSCFYPKEKFEVYFSEKYPGCLGLADMSKRLNLKYSERFITIKDADFDRLDGVCYKDIPNMFLTDTHDIETMMLTDRFVKQLECDFTVSDVKDKIDVAINEISHLSYIKWMNHKFNSKLNFKNCCKVGSCYNGTECVSIVQWLGKINAHPTNAGKKHFTERDIIDFEQKNLISSDDVLQLVCGHDMVDAIMQKIHTYCQKNISKQSVSNMMKRCFTVEYYKKTILCDNINRWLLCHNYV